MKRLLRFGSIRTTMILSFMVLISLIVLFLSLASYNYTVNDLENLYIGNTSLLLSEIHFNIDTYFDNMKSMAEVVAQNEDVRALMAYYGRRQNAELTALEQTELKALGSRASRHMNTVANTRKDITNIALITKYGDVVLSDSEKQVNPYSNYTQSDWYLRPFESKEEIFVSPSHVQNLILNEYKWVISLSCALVDQESGEVSGVVLIDLNYRAIEAICENAKPEQAGYIYLIDSKLNLIYHPRQQLIYSGIKTEDYNAMLNMPEGADYTESEDGGKLYIRNISDTTGWIAVGVIDTGHFMGNRAGIIRFYILLAYIAIVMAGVVAVFIAGAITKPIKTLEGIMRRVELGDFSAWSELHLNNEIGHLSNTFNAMITRIRHLMDDLVKNESEKRQSELMALQAQINPHFLYNTLDTIIWMSACGKNDEVVEITSALAQLFRINVTKGDSFVEIDIEIQNIESYLTIQKMRYLDKLTYRIEVSPETRALMTPKLILQPIVENAIYHGIKASDDGGEVSIVTSLEEGDLIITVRDTGVGIPPEKLSRILTKPQDGDDHGIGVLNVHNRIKLVFGPEYGLEYHSAEGRGTKVIIRMPAVERSELPNV